MKLSLSIVCTLVFMLHSDLGWGQDDAETLFKNKNFDDAYNAFSLLPEDQKTPEINYKMAVCILNGNEFSKKQAVDLLEKYLKAKPDDGNAVYLYARALAFEQRFNEAEIQFTKCLSMNIISPENKKDAGHELEYCQDARVLIPFAIDVTIEKLDVTINSGFQDYFPFSDAEETILYFNSRRNDGSIEKSNGDFYSNIYYSKVENGQYTRALPVTGKLNTLNADEEIVGLSADGKKAIVSFEDNLGNIDLRIANLDNGKVKSLEKLPKGVNTSSHEISATFGSSTNEIYFASDRPGGFGGIDLYVIRKKANGKWAEPQNLGPEINTMLDEDFPNVSHDGEFLFFSSKGHASMGGYDIFKAKWDATAARFVKPVNVGFPVSTLYDDMNLNFSKNGRYGFISRLTDKTQHDIYRVTFNETEPEITIVTGHVKVDKEADELLEGLLMVVENLKSGEISGEYLPNPNTMRYVMALEPGSYRMSISIDGYEPLETTIDILGKGDYKPQVEIDYSLKKIR